MWLVVNSMYPRRTPKWLAENMPGKTRSEQAINGHFNDMRLLKRLPQGWRWQTWEGAPQWTLEEDAEALMYHIWGRNFIDPLIFVKHNRPGKSIRTRARYLAQDTELVMRAQAMEQLMRQMTLERDTAAAEDSTVGDEQIAQMTVKLRGVETVSWDRLQQLIAESLAKRTDRFDPNDCSEEP